MRSCGSAPVADRHAPQTRANPAKPISVFLPIFATGGRLGKSQGRVHWLGEHGHVTVTVRNPSSIGQGGPETQCGPTCRAIVVVLDQRRARRSVSGIPASPSRHSGQGDWTPSRQEVPDGACIYPHCPTGRRRHADCEWEDAGVTFAGPANMTCVIGTPEHVPAIWISINQGATQSHQRRQVPGPGANGPRQSPAPTTTDSIAGNLG